MQTGRKKLNNSVWIFSATTAIVWLAWLFGTGPTHAVAIIQDHWPVTLTMIFGSFVAGATSEGGGAVAFPVLTKVLEVAPVDAKLFSLAIQSVGMSSAALAIIALRIPVKWSVIGWSSLGGVVGIYISLMYIAPHLPPPETKMFFSSLQAGFAGTLMLSMLRESTNSVEPFLSTIKVRWTLVLAGLVGGVASGLVGSGIDLIVFSTLVLLLKVSEKVATPTSVIVMAVNSLVGVVIYKFHNSSFPENVSNIWLAAVPVVVLGAPAGAFVCSLLRRRTIAWVLVALIAIEVLTSLLILPKTTSVACVGLVSTGFFVALFRWMDNQKRRSSQGD